MNTYIYALTDPLTDEIRYIGKSNEPEKRLSDHVSYTTKDFKTEWISSLKQQNVKPILEILDEVPASEWEFWERHYIALYRSWGFKLTNVAYGGMGALHIKRRPETIEKMRIAHTGKIVSAQTREKRRQLRLGKKNSPESNEKNRQSHLGRKQSPEAIAATAAANRGRKNTPETILKMSLAHKGKKFSKESLIRRSISQSKPVLQFDMEGNFIKEYPSGKAATLEISPYNRSLSCCLKGRLKSWCGYKWKYKN